jgi:ABC-type multidrug transport system fused ATPase/permease subunit
VAHRLRTIADSDLIGVVSAGKFVEVGHPLDLLRRDSSQFRSLAEESHEYEELLRISSRSVNKNKQVAI